MHEIAPFDDFRITHGLCFACESAHEDLFANEEIQRALFLQEVFDTLFDAGRRNDLETGSRIIDKAIDENCRPVDILMGMIAPMLFEIGEEWKRGVLSVEAEHRFTTFAESVIRLIKTRITTMTDTSTPSNQTPLFLMNAPGNRHNLAVRILSIWLEGRGAKVRIIEDDVNQGTLLRRITAERPTCLLISMGLAEQRDRVAEIAEAVQTLPHTVRPKIIVGGYPVKVGLVRSIPEAELLHDISALQIA